MIYGVANSAASRVAAPFNDISKFHRLSWPDSKYYECAVIFALRLKLIPWKQKVPQFGHVRLGSRGGKK